jgi:hypothetical protein
LCILGNFRFGSGDSSYPEEIEVPIPAKCTEPGHNTIVLKNTHDFNSAHWLVWDSLALRTAAGEVIWALGENEAPPDYTPTAFDEFDQSWPFYEDFCVGAMPVGEFPKEINDVLLPYIYVHFRLTEEQSRGDLILFLDTLYATHDSIQYLEMQVKARAGYQAGCWDPTPTPTVARTQTRTPTRSTTPTRTRTPSGTPPTPTRTNTPRPTSEWCTLGDFRFGSGASAHPEEIEVPVGANCTAPGENIILLQNTHDDNSGHWLVWDSLALRTAGGEVIWALGENEAPPDYTPAAFDEFDQSSPPSNEHFCVGAMDVGQFPKEINDGTFREIHIHFQLTEEQSREDLTLLLDTLYATHSGAQYFDMRVKTRPGDGACWQMGPAAEQDGGDRNGQETVDYGGGLSSHLCGDRGGYLEHAAGVRQGTPLPRALPAPASLQQPRWLTSVARRSVTILVDDFAPQPVQGEPYWISNRLGGTRGQVDGWWDPYCSCAYAGGGSVVWGQGMVTATITQTQGTEAWVGSWSSLNHSITEDIPLDFAGIFPSQILPQYQGNVTALRIYVLDGQGTFQVDLQAPDLSFPWQRGVMLSGGERLLHFDLPSLGSIRNLNWIIKGHAGDFVVVDRVELIVELPWLATAQEAFLWSYAMLLSNWDPVSGLTRDRSAWEAGAFDNVSASGMQAAAAAMAYELGFISQSSATEIVDRTSAALLALPRCGGVWPHFAFAGQAHPDSEWSSIDTIIAAVALLEAQQALGIDTSAVQDMLEDIDWEALQMPDGSISHGYEPTCTERLAAGWYHFGTESWLVNFAYAAATGNTAQQDSTPPTYNGSGFIDELAWLLLPPPCGDRWGTDWWSYRNQAAVSQLFYYQDHPCYVPRGLFGLSAVEVPDPSAVSPAQIYQAFGVGGEVAANDGTALLGHAAVVPHYSAMVAALHPAPASTVWRWLGDSGLFTPLNNVESLMFVDELACQQLVWNSLRGSWNLSLQTLGWGRQLAGTDNPLYLAVWDNDMLSSGYQLMGEVCYKILLPVILKSR